MLRSIDLSKSQSLTSRDPPTVKISTQPETVGLFGQGALWNVKGKLYEVSGRRNTLEKDTSSYTKNVSDVYYNVYNPDTERWSTETLVNGKGSPLSRNAAALSAEVPELGKGFVLGSEDEDNVANLAIFDYKTETWDIVLPAPWKYRRQGSLVHVPFGKNGLLIPLGGLGGDKHPKDPISMERIDIYDLNRPTNNALGVWAKPQYATAGVAEDGIPSEFHRLQCAVAVMAPDGSSAQVFVYGGHTGGWGDDSTHSEALWVLSIPSFEWYLVQNGTKPEEPSPGPRDSMTCDVFYKYMMVFGGEKTAKCDITGAFALDMANIKWISDWDAEEAAQSRYTIPKKVVDGIGGTVQGSSDIKGAAAGMNDSGLNELFSAHIAEYARREPSATDTNKPPRPTSNTPEVFEEKNVEEKKGTSTGVIVGAVITSLAGLAILVGGFWLMHRRKAQELLAQQRTLYNTNLVPGTFDKPAELDWGAEKLRGELDGGLVGAAELESGRTEYYAELPGDGPGRRMENVEMNAINTGTSDVHEPNGSGR